MAHQGSAQEQITANRTDTLASPAEPAPADATRAPAADIQTSSGVPAKPIGTSSSVPAKPIGTSSSVPAKPIGTSSSVPAKPIGTSSSVPAKPIGTTNAPPVVPGLAPGTAPTHPVSFAAAPGVATPRTPIPGIVAPARTAPDEARRTAPEPLIVEPGAATQATLPRKSAPGAAQPAPESVRPRRSMPQLGKAPMVLALSSFGVLFVALAYAGGRDGRSGAMIAYWIGQVVVFTPVVARLLTNRLTGMPESFLLVTGLAINQYFLKWMYSPDQFRFPDELQHWLATTIVLETDRLFQPNPALPPAVHFPGLAEMGAAVADMTGLPVTAAGLLVAGVAHLLFVVALYAVVQRASGSAAIAGVTCVIYATALHYLFFNSMYLYATAALPFLMLAVWATRRWRTGGGWPFAATAVVSIGGATVSHHVTAFVMVATLGLIGVTEWVLGGRPRRWAALAMPAMALTVVASWIAFVAQDVIGYLGAPVDQIADTVAILMGDQSDEAASAAPAPVSLVQLGIQGVGLLVLFALFLGVARDMLQKRDRDTWRWAALLGGGIFFAGTGVRFLGQSGPEIAGRLSTFTYVPISIIAAIALVQATRLVPRRNADGKWLLGTPLPDPAPAVGARRIARITVGALAITLLMVAARVGGWPPTWEMLPGPYLAAGFERSVDKYGIEAIDWTRETLGPDNRVGGDITTVFLASTYGRQDPVREAAPLMYSQQWGLADEELVTRLDLQYLVVDHRISSQLPASRSYFEPDPDAASRQNPVPPASLSKFDAVPDLDRIYDNGVVRIYRMGDR